MRTMSNRRVLAVISGLALCALVAPVGSASAATGSISGRAVGADTHEGLRGIAVCAFASFPGGPTGRCVPTDEEGNYTLANLESGVYDVIFDYEGRVLNYLEKRVPEITLTDGESIVGFDAELEPGGQIVGRVTDAGDSAPVAGVQVCAPRTDSVESHVHCATSGTNGAYVIDSLPSGIYTVEFRVFGSPNYITQYYNGRDHSWEADPVTVTAGAPTSDIDAAMREGIQITGTITEAGTGNPVSGTTVCAYVASTETVSQCGFVELDGTYSIAGLPLTAYVVGFAIDAEEDGVIVRPDGYVRQYWDGKATFAEADRLGGADPGVYTGIDARLVKGPEAFPRPRPLFEPPEPASPASYPATKARRGCRRHFRKRRIRGKVHCVRIHGHRVRRQHRHGHRRGGVRAGRRPA